MKKLHMLCLGGGKIVLCLAFSASLVMMGCHKDADSPTSLLANMSTNDTAWILVNMDNRPALPDTLVTLNFEHGRISGSDGCNRYNTEFAEQGANITINPNIVRTEMACAETIMQQADAYTAMLPQATAYQNSGQELRLSDAHGNTLATFAAQNRTLSGTSWIVTGYNTGNQAVVSVILGSELTANFNADGSLSGSGGCNNYIAAYEISGKRIKISPAAATLKMCADVAGVMEQETQYLQALETAATYRIEGDQLELRTADDALAATFEKVR